MKRIQRAQTTKHTTQPPKNQRNRRNKASKGAELLGNPTHSVLEVVVEVPVQSYSTEHAGNRKLRHCPDSQNHHHVATGATSFESNRSHQSMVRITYPLSRTDNRPAVAKDVTGQTPQRRGKTCVCPMVVSQWGLNSKNNQGETGPGHSMVVSQ